VLDLMGKGEEARKYFTKAIDVADTPEGKASAQRDKRVPKQSGTVQVTI
jgi:hypothetical protein